MASGTKERILDVALKLFAARGFEATGARDIADELGIKAPSLYKHYPSKQAIFDALVQRELDRHEQTRVGIGMGQIGLDTDAAALQTVSPQTMADFACALFTHWTTGDAALFRRMLNAERVRNPQIAQLYSSLFLTGPVSYQTQLFDALAQTGAFAPGDAATRALHFWSPLLLLMEQSDCGANQQDLLQQVRAHVLYFAQICSPERDCND